MKAEEEGLDWLKVARSQLWLNPMPARKLEKKNYLVSKVPKLEKFSTISMAIGFETLWVTEAKEAKSGVNQDWESTSSTLQWDKKARASGWWENSCSNQKDRQPQNKKMQCQGWEQQKHQVMRYAANWQQQIKASSNSKWEKQWGCLPVGRCFPASTKKGVTAKLLQNKSIFWKHLLLDPENSPCHEYLSNKSASSVQGTTFKGTAPSKSLKDLKHPGPV